MITYRNLLCLFLLNTAVFSAESQDISNRRLKEVEDSLAAFMSIIYSEKPSSVREEANTKFDTLLKEILNNKESFDYPFDSLKHIGKIKSDDNRVRIFTWNLPQAGGYQKYYGFILYKKDNEKMLIFDLNDSRKLIVDPIKSILTSKQWIGALYYSIINETYKGQSYYILLGFDFNNLFSSKKVIDVLTFGKDSEPVLGANIFKVDNTIIDRVVFEFSARVAMTLRYVADYKTIVFDHLAPSQPDFEGNYQFYGPDFTFDGFRFDNGYWIYVRNLDIRNPKREPVKPKESPEKFPEPGFLYKSKNSK